MHCVVITLHNIALYKFLILFYSILLLYCVL